MSNDFKPRLRNGSTSLLISVPHAGTVVPDGLLESMSDAARSLPDTDWFVDRLYDWALDLGAGMITAPVSRYVIDLNRPPDDAPLYETVPSRLLTGLVPIRTFAGTPIYTPGHEPGAHQIRHRLESYWLPYHDCLRTELGRIRQRHGHAVLLDAHSIRSQEPMLFDGTLPDLNLGSNSGDSAAGSLVNLACKVLRESGFSMVLDGRFKGGYITRHYGKPASAIHALQLEMAQCAYMVEDPPSWEDALAQAMQLHLQRLVRALTQWSPNRD